MKMSQDLPDFKEPTALPDAEAQLTALLEEIQSIQLQLADPNRVDEQRQRLARKDYVVWKHKAKYALTMKLRVYRHLKQWIKDHREKLVQQTGSYSDLIESARWFINPETYDLIYRYGNDVQQRAYLLVDTALKKLDELSPRKPDA